jgi:hypothetical protein
MTNGHKENPEKSEVFIARAALRRRWYFAQIQDKCEAWAADTDLNGADF